MKTLLNKIIDFFFEKKRTKKKYKPLTNKPLADVLSTGKLFVACLVSRNNNFASKQITKFSGPFSHVVVVWNMLDSIFETTAWDRLCKKFDKYYGEYDWANDGPQHVVLASADDNGMNYFSISEYQNREMIVFHINGSVDPIPEDHLRSYERVISEFLSPKVMNANYDYTGLVGQIFRKLGKLFYSLWDDERAYYCSEQAEIFKRHGVKIADVDEPTPTEIYKYCRQHYPVAYSSLTREY